MRKQGFTLAEVLITLGIIGVVAAMTIPTLMTRTNQAEFKTAYKKMISALNQAITMNVALDYVDWSDTPKPGNTDANSIYDIINRRMHVISTSEAADFDGITAGNLTMYLADGMVISFPKNIGACTEATDPPCYALVDINGRKTPNAISVCGSNQTTACTTSPSNLNVKDQFAVKLVDQQVLPHGHAAKATLFD